MIKSNYLCEINGIGFEIINALKNWFLNKNNLNLIKNLQVQGFEFEDISTGEIINKEMNKNFQNKEFVITGTMKNFSRSNLIEKIEREGGLVKNSLTKKIDFLIAGEKAGSKLEKAKELKINIINEEDLINLFK